MNSNSYESKLTSFANQAMRFTEPADDYEAKLEHLQERLGIFTVKIDELCRQLNQIELEPLEPSMDRAIVQL